MRSIFAATSMSYFNVSAGVLSGTAASPNLIRLMVMLISSIVSGITFIGMSVDAALMPDEFSGASLFNSSSKCSLIGSVVLKSQ